MNTAQWLILIEESESVVALLLPNGQLVLGEAKLWGEDKNKLLKNIQISQKECLSAVADVESPNKAVFVFSPFWINNEGELLGSKKELLKKVCQETGLKPLGFLVGDEVFSQFFDDFVAVYLGRDHMRVTVVKDRAVKNRQELENGDQFDIKDVSILLKQINSDVILPDNLVFWGSYNKRIKSELVDHDWKADGPFTKKPNLRTLEWKETFRYIGQLILKQSGASASLVSDKIILADQVEQPVESGQESDQETEQETELPFGFANSDLARDHDSKQVSSTDVEADKDTDSAGRPVTQVPEAEEEPKVVDKGKKRKKFSLKKLIPAISIPRFKNKKVLTFIPLIFVGIGLILGASWYFSKLDLEIYVTAKEISETKEVTLDPEADQLNVEDGLIPVEVVTAKVSDQASKETSGEKLIGEKSTGEVTIFNRTEQKETLPAGTELIGPGDFRFVLDNEVSVASKSADLVSGVDRWGEVKAQITAVDIGAEYNLAAESEFTIEGYSRTEFLARNDEDLSGGTSREVRAVSEDDQSQLRDQLKEKLEQKLLAELKDKIDNSRLIEGSIQTEVVSESFSAEVGEEKDELSLELELEGEAYELNEERLEEAAQNVLSEDLEEGFILPSDSIEVEFKPDEDEEGDQITGKLEMKGSLYPEIDKQEVARSIAGKSKQSAKKIIRSYPRVYRFADNLTPGFISWWPFYPPQAGNIIVRIKE